MPLESMTQLLFDARRRNYAMCYCEAWNIESFAGVLEAAEETDSPIIAGFNGGFLMHPQRTRSENLALYAGLGRALATFSVPVAFLLNETDDLAQIGYGIDLGFNAVMVESDHLGSAEYLQVVKEAVRIAHSRGVSVEAQVGRLPYVGDRGELQGEITDPAVARRFVQETEVDALGISIGNVHVLTKGQASIDLESLARIHDLIEIPLVIHGGTGFPLQLAAEAIRFGVAKFNFGTALKQAYLQATDKGLKDYSAGSDPHPFLGMGGKKDIMVAGKEAVKKKVKELLAATGSAGKAARRG
jgi:ketose-bisphosphate aldolase